MNKIRQKVYMFDDGSVQDPNVYPYYPEDYYFRTLDSHCSYCAGMTCMTNSDRHLIIYSDINQRRGVSIQFSL